MDPRRGFFSAVNQLLAARGIEELDRQLVDVLPGATGFDRAVLLALPTMQQSARVRFSNGEPALELGDVPALSPLAAGGSLASARAGRAGDGEEPHGNVRAGYALAPLREGDRTVALLYADGLLPPTAEGEALEVLVSLAEIAGVARSALNLAVERDRLLSELDATSRIDSLTSLSNQRVFEERLQAELHRSARSRRPFALVIFDLDGLEEINSLYGRHTGDEVLQQFGAVLRARARHMDFAARYGEDEFVMVLVDIDHHASRAIVDRVLDAAQEAKLSVPVRLSASAGIALNYPVDTAETLIERAQAALSDAKRSGRDRTKIT